MDNDIASLWQIYDRRLFDPWDGGSDGGRGGYHGCSFNNRNSRRGIRFLLLVGRAECFQSSSNELAASLTETLLSMRLVYLGEALSFLSGQEVIDDLESLHVLFLSRCAILQEISESRGPTCHRCEHNGSGAS